MRYRKLTLALALAVCLSGAIALAAKVMSVSVRDGQVRQSPSFLGKIVGKASYGQSVDVSAEQGDWAKVTLPGGVSGWMHRTALTTEKLALASGGAGGTGSVSGKEMALAGKGFSAQVEADYRRSHGGDFAAIDAMERISYNPSQLLAFLSKGDVHPQGGAK
ncbi:SH3 type 3 domain protein [Solidesulfovibrio fructosivorans JJ]]|uniref:SH3 type 3 domain protein n=1 Tax=Solidesulfovibrio fructosivorans JJ] TaxID=596151 RepID=E1JZH6_SOLFR|nr:SH3 domain-containing protein [Solidesulfovibrio fructosivorans]EFL50223.1 SH3 type 3 domain protein [Solidesulfovibrio fructosivorans JJ]]